MARTGLSHIALKSRDLKKTEEFYVDVLGCKVAFRHPPDMIFLTTPGSGDLLNFVKSSARTSGSQGLAAHRIQNDRWQAQENGKNSQTARRKDRRPAWPRGFLFY